MEQKKILWIVAALGIFLLVIFLGTLLIYSPQQQTVPVIMTADSNNNTWINQDAFVATTDEPEVQETKTEEVIPQDVQEAPQDKLVQTGDVTVISQGKTTVYSQDGITTIDLTKLSTSNEVAETVTEPAVRPVATRVPSSTPAPTPKVEEKKEVVPTVKPTAPKVTTPPKPVDQYWVQAASFVSKANADKARLALIDQKIPAEVFTHSDDDGVTFYRVRVGPYTTKSEAEYWNSLIQTVGNFADAKSYVTNTAKPAR